MQLHQETVVVDSIGYPSYVFLLLMLQSIDICKSETVHPLSEFMPTTLEVWEKMDEFYFETSMSSLVMDALESNNCVTLIGASGEGKTVSAKHAALQYRHKLPSFEVLEIFNPNELVNAINIDKRQFFLVNDPLGAYFIDNHPVYNILHDSITSAVAHTYGMDNIEMILKYGGSSIMREYVRTKKPKDDANITVEIIRLGLCEILKDVLSKTEDKLKFLNELKVHTTPLHFAAGYGMMNVVKFLISIGVDINVKSQLQMLENPKIGEYFSGFPPLLYAARQNHADVVEYMLQEGQIQI
ncbi:TNKS [Mytilus edulis]|uniref:TNKS n=1 Tax=Mytilus edulis TaxID=6550 RepID=A0A8S3S959_MYTED|nr:TNKS [Mytilus edulis]